jgi:hypothetical protein
MKLEESAPARDDRGERTTGPVLVRVEDVRPEGYDGTCLRPLGLCELGGCCDTCWYRPDHPRFNPGS